MTEPAMGAWGIKVETHYPENTTGYTCGDCGVVVEKEKEVLVVDRREVPYCARLGLTITQTTMVFCSRNCASRWLQTDIAAQTIGY